MEMRLDLRLSQQLVMTPQLQMAIKLLQLNRMELADVVREGMLENPLLEDEAETGAEQSRERDAIGGEADVAAKHESAGDTETQLHEAPRDGATGDADPNGATAPEFDWEGYLDQHARSAPMPSYRPDRDEMPSLEATLTRRVSLFEHLSWQLKLSRLDETSTLVGLLILGNLDGAGYLEQPLSELATEADVDLELAEKVLETIQTFDPLGVGSRSLGECLLIQAIHCGQDDDLVVKILRNHLPDLEKKNYPPIARTLEVPLDEIYEAVKVITSFNPRPGREYSLEEPRYITPDVYIHKVAESYFVVPNDDGLPKLRISGHYRSAFQQNGAAKAYVRDKLRAAQWLIRSIQQRQRTIILVTESILKFQRDFFEKGVSHLKPLILRDVADDISMHESTISRVTTNKYVHTPRGVYELKFFFSSGISRTNGDDLASQAVKLAIKTIISAEPKARPHSDQKIVGVLKIDGIDIARRTVAKYREQMGILCSSKRRQLF
jgi:RNA polymerase sigma-54 factor